MLSDLRAIVRKQEERRNNFKSYLEDKLDFKRTGDDKYELAIEKDYWLKLEISKFNKIKVKFMAGQEIGDEQEFLLGGDLENFKAWLIGTFRMCF